jgi:hypothetical protein
MHFDKSVRDDARAAGEIQMDSQLATFPWVYSRSEEQVYC